MNPARTTSSVTNDRYHTDPAFRAQQLARAKERYARTGSGLSPKPCDWCDKDFTPHNRGQLHCSTRCAQLHRQYRVRQATGYQSPHTRKWPNKGSTKERGLGSDHQRLRKQLLPQAYGKPCPMCGNIMHEQQQLDLDHLRPRIHGGTATRDNVRIVHHHCNRRDGQRLGHQRKQSTMRADRGSG